MRNLVPIIFYGNIFYGLCAVALCVETNLQLSLPLNGPHFYFLVFAVTVVYYTRIYYRSSVVSSNNLRSVWYTSHRHTIVKAMYVALALMAVETCVVLNKYLPVAGNLHATQWLILAAFPLVAFLYTFKTFSFLRSRQLRGIGWLKPFFIGFAWSGLVSVYPVIVRQMQMDNPAPQLIAPAILFWFQNFLFISALAILFDIKDFMSDVRFKLKTYPAILGNKKTILFVVLPTALASFIMLLVFLHHQQASPFQIAVQTAPYLLLVLITTMLRQRGILFYLIAIDGLMLLKGVCGILSKTLF